MNIYTSHGYTQKTTYTIAVQNAVRTLDKAHYLTTIIKIKRTFFCFVCSTSLLPRCNFVVVYFIIILSNANVNFCKGHVIYMGSSLMLVLTGSHSRCNSFVANEFLFIFPHQMEKIPKKQWEQCSGKNMFCLFFTSKIYSHVTQKWRPKMGMAIPYCLFWKLLHTRRKYSDI